MIVQHGWGIQPREAFKLIYRQGDAPPDVGLQPATLIDSTMGPHLNLDSRAIAIPHRKSLSA